MSAALHWHQHPGLAGRWVLVWVVLAAHAALLWFWPIGRPQAMVQQITLVRVVMVDEAAAAKPRAQPAIEPVPLRSAAVAPQSTREILPQAAARTGLQSAQQADRQSAQGGAPASPPSPPLAHATVPALVVAAATANVAPAKASGGESSAKTAVTVTVTGASANTAARADGPGAQVQMSIAAAAPGPAPSMQDLCPHTVKAVPPARATQAGLGGMVLARATIQGGKVRRVEILKSEPGGLYDAAVRAAMAQYVCRDQGGLEVLAEQLFEFKVVE